jgi:membrane-bound lytic murein transglycosylase B
MVQFFNRKKERWFAAAGIFLIACLGVRSGGSSTPSAQAATTAAATSSTSIAAQQQALENQLQQLEGQITQYDNQISADEQKGTSLTAEINQLNAQVAKVQLQIQATNLTLQEINDQITQTQSQIGITANDIASKKALIGTLLQALYENDQVSAVESFLQNPRLSDIWAEVQNISLLEANLGTNVAELNSLTTQLQSQNQQLAVSQTAAASAQAYELAQAQQIAAAKTQKNQLLTVTKGEESIYKTLVTKTKQTAAQIRNQIFQLLGGGQLTFEQAYQYAQLASQATGVDPALILAVLDRESALGQNVGQCSYKTAMSPSNIPVFLQIVQQLGLDPNNMMVSCPNSDGVYGGAMGPAQFEPSTWELYAPQISKITGDNPPSPWKNADAFVATALYLQGAMQGCQASYSTTVSQERCTAAKYYAGSNWRNYLWTYGEAIVEQAQTFTQDIATITSSS